MAAGFFGLGHLLGAPMGVGGGVTPGGGSGSPAVDPRPGTWILDLDVGGRVFRYSTRELVVHDAFGNAYLYRPGLADFEMDVGAGDANAQAFRVTDRSVDWAGLVADGVALYLANGILRHIQEGEVLEEALVALDGRIDEPEYADPEAPASLVGTLQVDFGDALWPDPRAQINDTTWLHQFGPDETFDEGLGGAWYPFIFGYPGDATEGAEFATAATPALMVRHNGTATLADARFLICDGVCEAQEVRLYTGDTTAAYEAGKELYANYPVIQIQDLLNRTVSIIEVPFTGTSADVPATPGVDYYIGWSSGAGLGGGNLLPDRSGPVRDLTDVALYALRNSGREVDLQAQEGQRGNLSAFQIDGGLYEELEMIPWFESTLMPLFPLVRARTKRGMYWRFLDWAADAVDPVGEINVDEGHATRITSVKTPMDAVANVFRIDYGFSLKTGSYGHRRILSNEAEKPLPRWENPDYIADLRVVGSTTCARSQNTFGIREAKPIATKFVWSATTATTILRHMAFRDSFPRLPVAYMCNAREVRRWTMGDVVVVNDAGAAFRERVAIVVGVTLTSGRQARVDVQVMDPRVRG